MSEVLIVYDEPIRTEDGRDFRAQLCARPDADGLWSGWIEFVPATEDAEPVRTGVETKQPDRAGVGYWGTGLTITYLQGALSRALGSPVPNLTRPPVDAQPHFPGPRPAAPPPLAPRAVLDPFAVYAQGEDVLRRELSGLDEDHLKSIARAFDLRTAHQVARSRAELADAIVTDVKNRSPR